MVRRAPAYKITLPDGSSNILTFKDKSNKYTFYGYLCEDDIIANNQGIVISNLTKKHCLAKGENIFTKPPYFAFPQIAGQCCQKKVVMKKY